MKIFTAQFPGTCYAGCGEPIAVGEDVGYYEEGVVIHANCHELAVKYEAEMDAMEAKENAACCSDCHMVHGTHQKECW